MILPNLSFFFSIRDPRVLKIVSPLLNNVFSVVVVTRLSTYRIHLTQNLVCFDGELLEGGAS